MKGQVTIDEWRLGNYRYSIQYAAFSRPHHPALTGDGQLTESNISVKLKLQFN